MQDRTDPIRCGATGQYEWIGTSLRVGVPNASWLDRLDDLLGLDSKRGQDLAPEIAVHADGRIQCFATQVRFDSVRESLIWLSLTSVDLLSEKNRLLLLHAASVLVDDRVLLIFGPPYSGKSTLARLAMSQGLSLLGDDVVRISHRTGRVEAVPRPLKTRTSEDEVWRNRKSDPLEPGSDLYGGLHGRPCILTPRSHSGIEAPGRRFQAHRLYFLERCSGPGVSSRTVPRFQALTSLLQYARDWSTPPLKAARRAAQQLLDLPHCVVTVGDGEQEAALDLILSGRD